MYKEKILEAREQYPTLSMRKLASIVGCRVSTVTYHLSSLQKEQREERKQKLVRELEAQLKTGVNLSKHPYHRKGNSFQKRKPRLHNSLRYDLTLDSLFTREFNYKIKNFTKGEAMFTAQDVIDKFGENPTCYLTGDTIDIYKTKTYNFDHIIPVSRGGDNSLDNLGICTKEANVFKSNKTPEELVKLCHKIINQYNKNIF